MKIHKLHIEGFGHIQQREFDLDENVTILYGPNEAGKSTVLGFMRSMLYGIPSRTYTQERYEPVHSGVHGGSMIASDEEGTKWLIERYAQPPEGTKLQGGRSERLRITRTNAEGNLEQLTQSEMERILLGGMSREMFKQIFAISLTELQEVALLQSEEMSSFLFHAGIGGGSSIVHAERKLTAEMDKLYKPRGRNQEAAKIIQSIEKLEDTIAESRLHIGRFNELAAELERTDKHLAELEQLKSKLQADVTKLQRTISVREAWLKLQEVKMELASLPVFSQFPENIVERWNMTQQELSNIHLTINELQRTKDRLLLEINSITLDEPLLEQSAIIDKLYSRLENYEKRKEELTQLKAEKESLQLQLSRILRQINAAWNEDDLQSFSGAVGEREAVRRYAEQFANYDREMDHLQSDLQQSRRRLSAAEMEVKSAEVRLSESVADGKNQFSMLKPADEEQIVSLWNELQYELDRWREQKMTIVSREQQQEAEIQFSRKMRSLYVKLFTGSAVFTVIMPLLLWLSGTTWGAAISAAVLLAVDVLLLQGLKNKQTSTRRGSFNKTKSREQNGAEERLQQLLSSLFHHPFTAAGRSGKADNFIIDAGEMERELQQIRLLMDRFKHFIQHNQLLRRDVESARSRWEVARAEVERVLIETSAQEQKFEQLEQDWEAWLVTRKLEPDLSPEAVLDIFAFTEQGMDIVHRIGKLDHRLAQTQQDCELFEDACCAVLEGRRPEEGVSAAAYLHQIGATLEEQKGRKQEWDKLRLQKDAVETQLSQNRDRLQQLSSLQDRLLQEGQASDEESLLRNAAAAERRKQLEQEARHLSLAIYTGLDQTEQEELNELLTHADGDELERELEHSRSLLRQHEMKLTALQELRGRLLQERESIESLHHKDDHLQQLEEQRTALAGIVDQYAVMAICGELMARTQKIYEEEKQPQVLKMASSYFWAMTGGRYVRIVMKVGHKELLVEHNNGSMIESARLSRGTAEQLYLAMRFALADSMSGLTKLPLLFDDIFVNFDAARLDGTLTVLQQVAEMHQIVLMTCHQHVVEQIKKVIPESKLITLSS
ncbi:ATP-binding protein [Paenibacillus sediminis]|uniref:Uncharacterized protein YhaN n=1 Tax=Paenibacillus sediminis TaxID=664909 RepID=A0ABS4H647_9BACL|nr:AAA family ATPase [Paenibacillus sediminis]MBP1937717.1 uncharacterized protein YhaN [Paenibacillus sediminis]